MRITEGMMTDKFVKDYNKLASQKAKTEIQVANNAKIQTLSDDLSGALDCIKLQNQINKTDSYLKNCNYAMSFIDSSLNALDNVTTQAQTIVSTITSTENPINLENYASIAQSIKDSLSSMVQSLNSKQNDMYLFGGTNYKGDPVSIVNGLAVVTTEDISGHVQVQVSQNTNVSMNISGKQITDSGIFTAVNNLINRISAGEMPTDAEKAALTDAYKKLVDIQSLAGQSHNRVDDLKTVLSNQQSNYNELLANIQQIDTAKLATDLQMQDYLLQVINQLLANTLSKTVFDYL